MDLVEAIDADFEVYQGTTFKAGKFAGYLADHGMLSDWPRTPTGHLATDHDTFSDMTHRFPQLQPLKELLRTPAKFRSETLAVGPDGRNRMLLSPFGASSGRNTPKGGFIFSQSAWMRGLIKPAPGRAVAYLDWSAKRSTLPRRCRKIPHCSKRCSPVTRTCRSRRWPAWHPWTPPKKSHKAIREMCKTCVLGTNYGMQAQSLALRTGLSVIEASELLRRLAQTFPTFTAWAEHTVDVAQLTGRLSTVFGWTLHVEQAIRPTTLRNYPMQANGAEMLRLACCLATEAGITVCAPVHDALLIEADTDAIDAAVATTRAAMAEASRIVLGGLEIATDAEIVTIRTATPTSAGRSCGSGSPIYWRPGRWPRSARSARPEAQGGAMA